jgi:hypothetical protein
VAVLITTVPQGWQAGPYYTLMAPQIRGRSVGDEAFFFSFLFVAFTHLCSNLSECLLLKGESHLEKGYLQSALLAIGRVIDESLDLARGFFIRPMLQPLLSLRRFGMLGIESDLFHFQF